MRVHACAWLRSDDEVQGAEHKERSLSNGVFNWADTWSAVGSIDAILNFAGVIKGGPLVEMDDADLALVMSVNVVGTCLINKHFFPLIKPGPAAKIVNVASEVSKARISTAFNAPYTMSKLAVEAYSDSLRQELSLLRNPIAVTVVQADAFKTPLTEFKTPLNFGSFGKGRAHVSGVRQLGEASPGQRVEDARALVV